MKPIKKHGLLNFRFLMTAPAAILLGARAARAQTYVPYSTAAPSVALSTGAAPVVFSTAPPLLPEWLTERSTTPPQEVWNLDQAVAIALENNPDLQSARANLAAAGHVVQQTYSGYLPSLNAYGQYYRATLPSPSAGSTALLGLDRPYSDALLDLRQTLFDFGQNLELIESAKAQRGSAEQQMLALRNIVVLNTQRAFYNVADAEKLVDVAIQSFREFKETYRRADLMVRTGVRPPFDRTQAEVELDRSELAVINARNTLDLSRIALLNLMGMTRQLPFALKEEVAASPARAESLDLDRLTQRALDSRPEMKRADYEVESFTHLIDQQKTGYFPTLDADAWYGSFLSDFPDALRHAHGYGLEATWNLFGGLNTTFRERELQAERDESEARRQGEAESVVAEVAAAYDNLLRAEQSQTVADEALRFGEENFDYARLRYNADVGTILELLVAQAALVDAQAGDVTASYRTATALASLRQAVNAPLTP